MPSLKHQPFPYLLPVPRFLRGIFLRPMKTSRKNWRVLCHAAAQRLFLCSRLLLRNEKNGNFCMSADPCRNPYTLLSVQLAEDLLLESRSTSTWVYSTCRSSGCKDIKVII